MYYFRLYDLARARAVDLDTSSSYPSIVGEGGGLVFTVSGLPNGTTTAGVTTAATTSASDFGVLPVSTEVNAAQRLTIDTNAARGIRSLNMLVRTLQMGWVRNPQSVAQTQPQLVECLFVG